MMGERLHITRGMEPALSAKAAQKILSKAKEILEAKNYLLMALCGGRSVDTLYRQFSDSLDEIWHRIHIFLADERIVPLDSQESNYKLIDTSFVSTLMKKGIVPVENFHPFMLDIDSSDWGVHEYQEDFKRMGSRFDILVLSAGEDGHVASLFPSHPALNMHKGYVLIHDSPKEPHERMTITPGVIADARLVILFFMGESKRKALESFLDEKVDVLDCPAKIALSSDECAVFTDLEAAA